MIFKQGYGSKQQLVSLHDLILEKYHVIYELDNAIISKSNFGTIGYNRQREGLTFF